MSNIHQMAAHIQDMAVAAARQAAMQRHPSVVSKRLAAAKDAELYAEHLDDTMPSADEIADMHAWADMAAVQAELTSNPWDAR